MAMPWIRIGIQQLASGEPTWESRDAHRIYPHSDRPTMINGLLSTFTGHECRV